MGYRRTHCRTGEVHGAPARGATGYTAGMPEYEFPRPALTADVVAVRFNAVPHVLLVRRVREPYAGRWALPGGFVEEGEAPESAAVRELAEETGLLISGPLPVVGVYGEPGRDPRGWVVTVAYLARVDAQPALVAGDDAAEVRWFSSAGLPDLAFDHSRIVADALARVRV